MSIKKYIENGFDINELLIAGFHAGQARVMSKLNEMSNTREIAELIQAPNITPSLDLQNAHLGVIDKPPSTINYVIHERDSWISTLSIFVDIVLLQEYLSKIDMFKNLTETNSEALKRRSELYVLLRSLPTQALSGFYMLYAHKPLQQAIVDSFYEAYQDKDQLANDLKRMSPETIYAVLSSSKVKYELRRFCDCFKEHSKSMAKAINRIKEYLGIPMQQKATETHSEVA